MHIIMGVGVVYIVAWGLRAFLRFLRSAQSPYERGIAGVVLVLYTLTGLSGLGTIIEAVGHHYGVEVAVVEQSKAMLRIGLPVGTMAVPFGQIWLWPLWRQRRQLLARYVEPELIQVRHDLLNLTAAQAELHLDISHVAYAHRAIVDDVVARCRAAGISPARIALARMATSLLTFHRENLLQDPSYGLITSWEELMAEAAAELDQAMARTAWEQALRDGTLLQQVYILMFLVLDSRAFREILLVPHRPRVQSWHQQLADLIATVMHAHGHATPRFGTVARQAVQEHGVYRRGGSRAGRWVEALRRLGKPAHQAGGSLRDRTPFHTHDTPRPGEASP